MKISQAKMDKNSQFDFLFRKGLLSSVGVKFQLSVFLFSFFNGNFIEDLSGKI